MSGDMVLDPIDIKAVLAKWQKFCLELFGREIDPSKLTVPVAREDINFPIVVTENLSAIIAKCRERFPYWQWTDEDLGQIVESDRTAENGAYVVLVRSVVEADEIHKGKSDSVLKRDGVISITLEERLTYELFYHWDTGGKHLDLQNVTLCAGSRRTEGGVPRVYFFDGYVDVHYENLDRCDDYRRVREVVSATA